MEGLADFVYDGVNELLAKLVIDYCDRKLVVLSVTVWEDSKNRATYKL